MMIVTSNISSSVNRKATVSTLNDKLRSATIAEAGSANLYEENLLKTLVSDFSQDAKSNPENFTNTLHESFGDKASAAQIDQLASSVLSGDVTMPASIEFVNAGALGAGVSGAYVADDGGRILLDGSLKNDAAMLERVFIEEFGHHLEGTLADVEPADDEGAFISGALLKGLSSSRDSFLPDIHSAADEGTALSTFSVGLPSEADISTDPEPANTELYNRIVASIEDARSGLAQSEANLVAVMKEVVLALRAQGINVSVSADSEGRVYQDFRHADLLPNTKYDQLVSGSFGGRGKNDETPNTAIVRIFVENIDDEALLFSAGLLSQQLSAQLGAPDDNLLALEHQLEVGVSTEADRNALLALMEQLDQQQLAQGQSAVTQRVNGRLVFSESLFNGVALGSLVSPEELNGRSWYTADSLGSATLLHAAEQLRSQVVLQHLGETAILDHEMRGRALDLAFEHLTVAERDALLDSSNNLQRVLQLFHEGSRSKSELADVIVSTYREFQAHGISGLHRFNEQGQIWLPDAVPNIRGPNASAEPWDRGDFGNLTHQSGQFLNNVVADLLGAPAWHAGMVNLEQFGVFAGESPIHIGSLRDALSPGSLPVDANDPSLVESLQNAVALNGASSASELRSLSRQHFTTASHLLTQNARGLSRDDMIAAYGLINADGLEAFGYQESITIQVGGKSDYEESQGPYGGLSRESYQFAQSWLNTSREQRLEHLGLDANKWNQAESFIAQGIETQIAADKAEFGFDDAIKIAVAVGISIYVGGATSGLVAGLLPAGTSVATGALISGAAGAAAGSFSSTLILTGDIEEALKSGAVAAITGGVARYAQNLGGAVGQVAEAITGGVAAELSGGEFKQGLMNVVGTNFGQSVQDVVGENFNAFVAGFSGKVTQLAIITGGNTDLMEDYLIAYIENFASDQAQSFLSSTVGPHSRTASIALSGLADAVIRSHGNLNKIEAYIEGGEFLQALAPQLRADITSAFGGEDSFKAVLLGNITDMILASNGDLELIEQNIGLLALSVASDWAGGVFTDRVNDLFGTEAHPLVDSVSTLLQAGITSGWDSATINAIAYGPVLDNLTSSLLHLLPASLGGAEDFIAGSLETLVTSYSANNGDTEAIARDLAIFIGAAIGQDLLDSQSSHGEFVTLTLGSSGERVAGVQQSLIEHGYLELDSVLLGEFDQTTAEALHQFQSDQLNALRELEQQPTSSVPSALDDRPLAVQFTYLLDEQFRGEVGELTALLLESPLVVAGDTAGDSESIDVETTYTHSGDINRESDSASISRLQERLNALSGATNNPALHTGTVDGLWGEKTEAALRTFQEDQLRLLNTVLAVSEDAPAHRVEFIGRLRNELVEELALQKTGTITGSLLSQPLTDSSAYELQIAVNAPLSGAETLAAFESLGDDSAGGVIEVNFLFGFFRSSERERLLDINKFLEHADYLDVRSVVDQLTPAHLQKLGSSLDTLDAGELADFVDNLAPSLNADELFGIFTEASTETRKKLVEAAFDSGDEALRSTFADLAQREMLRTDTQLGKGLSGADRELMLDVGQLLLDVGQLSLDVVGIFDPSPAADSANVVISLLRGDLFGAGLSAISIIPYIGDLAKVGKLGKWAQTVEAAIEGMNDAHLAPVIRPYLETLSALIDSAQGAVWNNLPTNVRTKLDDLKTKIDDALALAAPSIFRNFGDNEVTWVQDGNGNTVGVSAVLREVFPTRTHPRSLAESRLATEIGRTGEDTDVGGHILGHLFLGADSGRFNIVPQHGKVRTSIDSPNLNQGAYSKMENELADWIDHGMEVKLDIEVLDYADGRPSTFSVRYEVTDPKTKKLIYDNREKFANGPGQEFDRFISSDMQNRINIANGVI